MQSFVVDAHAIAWFLAKTPNLSRKAAEILRKAERSEVEVLIPTIVLAELLYLSERKKVPVEMDGLVGRLTEATGFAIVPFDLSIFEEMLQLPQSMEIHDRVIAATGIVYGAKIITKDEEIRAIAETVW